MLGLPIMPKKACMGSINYSLKLCHPTTPRKARMELSYLHKNMNFSATLRKACMDTYFVFCIYALYQEVWIENKVRVGHMTNFGGDNLLI